MRLKQVTAPTAEPIHLTEAKLHLNLAYDAAEAVADTSKDDFLTSIISVARVVAETEQWRALVLQTFDLFLDSWPLDNQISLPKPPLRSVEFVKYTDSAGNVSTFDNYSVDTDSTPGRIVLNYSEVWPSATLAPKNPIQIRFKCGYLLPASADADSNTLTAINHYLSDGDAVRLSVSGGSLPPELSLLTDYYVVNKSGDDLQLALTSGGDPVAFTTAGSGNMFINPLPEMPKTTMQGMKLVLGDLYEERADTVIGRTSSALPQVLPRAATHLFAMDTAKEF